MRDICQYLSWGRARQMIMMMMMLDKRIWCNSHSTEMPNTRGRAQMANIAAASLQNKRLGTQTWKAAMARDMHRLQYLPLLLEPHTLWLTTFEWRRGQSVRATSHAKTDVESVEQYKYSHIHNVIHSDSHTRKLSFKFSVLFVNIFSFYIVKFASKWPLRMPANDISRHYLATD